MGSIIETVQDVQKKLRFMGTKRDQQRYRRQMLLRACMFMCKGAGGRKKSPATGHALNSEMVGDNVTMEEA